MGGLGRCVLPIREVTSVTDMRYLLERKPEMKKNRTLLLRITLGIIIILLAWVSTLYLIAPRAVSANAPATSFSAERAMADLQVVSNKPHGAGSPAQAKVRDYIVEQIEALGLVAEIETSGSLANLLVRLSGTDSTRQVLVSGHYDSNLASPGAGDDGISVVAMLESIRVLHASPTLRNDVLFLFTDAEESGWTGARAFLKAHPEARDETGILLVFDARPGNAPLTLRKTSPGDAWLLNQMTWLPLPMWAGSWINLQERSEKNTDYDVLQPAGYTGILFENEANGTRYHTNRDNVDAISPNLVQAYGETMLALTKRFGNIDLRTPTAGPDLAYFTLSLVGLVAYPYWLMMVLTSLGILALLFFIVFAWWKSQLSWKRLLLSMLGLLIGIVLIVLCAQLAWGIIEKNQVAVAAVESGFEGSAIWQAILMSLAALLMIVLMAFLSYRLGGIHLAIVAPVLFLLLGFAFNSMTNADNPLTTPWLAWSFIGGVCGLGVLLFIKDPVLKVVLLSFAALLVLAVALPRIWMATYTREDAWLTVLVVCIWMGLFTPQVEAIFGQALAKPTDA
jgi:Peptidase family M28